LRVGQYCSTMSLDADLPPVETSQSNKKKPSKRAFVEWAVVVVIAVLASFLLRTFVVQTFFIPSASMQPTLFEGNRIVVDKLAVTFGTINRGDIVVFKAPPNVANECNDPVADLVKRVIGLPGDHLTSKGNTIYVNGKVLHQNWSHYTPLGVAIGNVTVPAGQYFMMGDNHADSCDSRTWGTVPRSNIIGKVFVKFWPLSEFTWY